MASQGYIIVAPNRRGLPGFGQEWLEEISGEYIGVDEKLAVNSLLRIIEAGGSEQGIAKAKETYEFVTGDEFVDRATAEKWLREEYKPSDVDTDD